MSIPVIHPRAFYGMRTDVRGNAHYITDYEILYSAGGVLIVHNYHERKQRYIKLMDKSLDLLLICVSPNKTLAAMIENGEKAQIIIFDMKTLKKKRTLNLPPDATTNRFESISFSFDEKYIVAVSGEPDWMMYCYNWEKGKIETMTRANYQNNPTPVYEVLCSPSDSAVVLLYGQSLFRIMNMQETVWRQYGFQKADQLTITAAVFLTNDRIVAGTQDGKLLLVDNAELRAVYDAVSVTFISTKEKEDAAAQVSATSLLTHKFEDEDSGNRAVTVLIALNRGFAYACKPGQVHVFEKESTHKYRKRNLFVIEEVDYREVQNNCLNEIKFLSIDISQEKLLATTNKSQIYVVRLWGPDINSAPQIPFKHLGESLHHGPINSLSLCVWKPIFMTSGKIDRTVRVWNFETETLELVKQYQEDIYSVALHPTGLFAVIGFADKLRFSTVLIDDIQPSREFPIRECKLSEFSRNGHYFASVNGNAIQVYSSISYETVHILKGHNGIINSLLWSSDDKYLISCGSEGAVYQWDIMTGKRVGEIVTKNVSFTGVAITSDSRFIYAAGNDGLLKEINESAILKVFDLEQTVLNNIVLARSDFMMFVSGDGGKLISLKIPLTEPPEYTVFHFHNSRVGQMKLSYDDKTLLTTAQSGALCIWKLSSTEGKTVFMEKDFQYYSEILISRTDLEEKILSINDLAQRMHELEMEHAYQMRQIDSAHADKIKDIHETYCQAIEELKDKNELLESEHNTELQNINSDVNKLKQKHERVVEEIESNYNTKLIVEYEKYVNLEEQKAKVEEEFEEQLQNLEESKTVALTELKNEYESKLFNLYAQLDEAYEENKKQQKEHEEVKQQIEDDADREIVELKAKYEVQLKEEKDNNVKLRGETGVMKKKFVTAMKDIEEYRIQIQQLHEDHEKFQSIIQNLERDILDLKKEISERDSTLQEKEKRIYDLKRKNQELEKFKFVLNYKIKELKSQIEPKDREIREKKELISDMEMELENLQKINLNLDVQLLELREKLRGADTEVQKLKIKNSTTSSVLRHIKIDVYDLAARMHDVKTMKDGIKEICIKYAQDDEFVKGRKSDEDLKTEFMRQREFLEQTILALKSTLDKSKEVKLSDTTKIMEDNIVLIEEINKLRKEYKISQRRVHELETLCCLKMGKHTSPKIAYKKLQQALKGQEDIRVEHQSRVDEAELKVELLKEEVQRLVDKVNESDLPKLDDETEEQ